jgi:hypothetical protein
LSTGATTVAALTAPVEKAKNQAMIRAVLATTILAAVACGRSKGVPDQELGNLVVETTKPAPPIDVARAAKDPVELGRALMQPHRKVAAAVGAHTALLASKTTVDEGGKVVSDMSEQTKLELGDKDTFHAEYTNTADYGREAIFAGDKLYLRPRYQRWHRRAPETVDEPLALRDSFYSPVAATWDLLAPGAELTDQGATQVAGRAGRKIAVKLAPTPAKPAAETLTQRKWRETRVVEELTGEIVLDDKGAPLAVKLAGTVSFMRDGRRFKMKTSLTSELSGLGTPVAITPPADTDVVATPERPREVDDRDFLLQGIAPPIRKAPEGP